MALIPTRVDRTSKPPIGTPLRSDGHWSVQGLVGVWAFNEGCGDGLYNSVSNRLMQFHGAPTWTATGVQLSGPVSSDYISGVIDTIGTGKNTIVTRVSPSVIENDNYTNYHLVNLGPTGTLDQTRILIFNRQVGSGIITLKCGYWGADHQTSYSFDKNKTYDIVDVYDQVDIKLYVNGSLRYQSWSYAAGNIASGSIDVGRYAGGGDYDYLGGLEYLLIYKVALSPSQAKSISANPWQIYEPETVWIEVGGGGEAALFAGSIYGQSSASAQLSTAITIASQVVASGSISGGINTAIRLATSAQGYASASALLTTAIRMAASAQGYGSATADLSTTIALAADILAASSASGALSTSIRFGGALSGASTTTAALSSAITMAAQAAGLGSISGQLAGTVAAALFAGTIQGSSSASANLSTAVVLAAAAHGSATAQAALSTALELAAQVNGVGSATGALGADISGLAGSMSGSSESQATLSTAIHLMGLAAGQCGVVGRLAEPVEILAQLRVMASDPLALTISVRDPLALRVTVQ